MIEIDVLNERFMLHEERCLYWPSHKLLVVADLHLGKSETFQQNGLWLSSQANADDLQRLLKITRNLDVKEILFLGDLIHSARGITSEIRALFADWITQFDGIITVAIGNHDLPLVRNWPPEWAAVGLVDKWSINNFVFQHETPAVAQGGTFYWVGHVHPMVRIESGPDRLRLPSFVITRNLGHLPAFSSLAGGQNISLGQGRKIYPVGENQVFSLS
jgi:DNA ligase-associated metallophosphoesterase